MATKDENVDVCLSVMDAMHSCEEASSAKTDAAGHNMRMLPENYEPCDDDVLCGRGRKCFDHPGNVKFRSLVISMLPAYNKAVAKLEKSYILSDVVEQVRKNSGVGGFIRKDPDSGRWYEVGDFLAREKTSQAFRDVLHDKYKSSNSSKKKRRQDEQAQKLFRAHSARSLGGSSLDASSVHSVGSSTTGDFMQADTKLMRVGQSNTLLIQPDDPEDDGFAHDDFQEDDFYQDDGLGGGSNHDFLSGGSNHSLGGPSGLAPRNGVHRQRSFRDTNRRGMLRTDFYKRSSCPDLFADIPRSNTMSSPPISQIEISQDGPVSGSHNPVEGLGFEGYGDLDSHETATSWDTSGTATSGSDAGYGAQLSQGPWLRSPTREAPSLHPLAGQQRRPFQRQRSNRMMRRNPSGLSTVQMQIGNLGLNDSNHGQSFVNASMGGLDGSNHSSTIPQAQFPRHAAKLLFGDLARANSGSVSLVQQEIGNLGLNDSSHGTPFANTVSDGSNLSSTFPPALPLQGNVPMLNQPHGTQGNLFQNLNNGGLGTLFHNGNGNTAGDNSGANNDYVPLGMQQRTGGQLLADQNVASSDIVGGTLDNSSLFAQLSALENAKFEGIDTMEDNPFEPVPLREG